MYASQYFVTSRKYMVKLSQVNTPLGFPNPGGKIYDKTK